MIQERAFCFLSSISGIFGISIQYTILCIDHDELQHLCCRPSTPLVPGSADWPTGAAACQSPARGEVPFLESYRMLFRSDSCALFPLFDVIWPELLSGIRIKDQSILICRCQGSTCCSVACLHHVYTKAFVGSRRPCLWRLLALSAVLGEEAKVQNPVETEVSMILLMEEILHQLIGSLSDYFQCFIYIYIPGSAGFLPSTVWVCMNVKQFVDAMFREFATIQYRWCLLELSFSQELYMSFIGYVFILLTNKGRTSVVAQHHIRLSHVVYT